MKTDILLPGVIAVTIHALIFSVPLSKTMNNNTHAYMYEPISVRIISPREPAAAVPPVQATLKPRSDARSHVSGRRTVISKKEVGSEKRLTAKNMSAKQSSREEAKKPEFAANSDNQHECVKESSIEQMRKDQGKKIDSSSPVKIASRGQGNIVYARPKYKENPLPYYPKIARRRGYEGKTLLRVKVLENGKTGKIEVEESSGFKVLDTAALKSVSDWTFVPGKINGKKTEQWISVPIRFVLK